MNWLSYPGAVVTFVLFVSSVHCIDKSAYPDITRRPRDCWNYASDYQPTFPLRICDPDHVFSTDGEQARELQKIADDIRSQTRCPCSESACHMERLRGNDHGYTLTLAVTENMGPNKRSSNLVGEAREYVRYLRRWRGYSGRRFARCNEDITVFLATEDKVLYIWTGAKARKRVSDETLANIIQQSKSRFKDSVFSGLKYILSAIKVELLK